MARDENPTRPPSAPGDVEIDAELAARALGIPVARFMAELRRGTVHGLVETGIDEDAGRQRLRLRHRGREARLVFEGGRLVRSTPGGNARPPDRAGPAGNALAALGPIPDETAAADRSASMPDNARERPPARGVAAAGKSFRAGAQDGDARQPRHERGCPPEKS